MKKFFLIFFSAVIVIPLMYAQDIITLKNGNDIEAFVQEIGDVEIKYKKFENPDGPNYILKKTDIFMIRYKNGSKDVFTEDNAVSAQLNKDNRIMEASQKEIEADKSAKSDLPLMYDDDVYFTKEERKNKSNWGKFNIGVSFPGSDLGNDVGTGFGVGLKSYNSNRSISPDLYLVYGVEFYYHKLSSDSKGYGIDVTYPAYLNLPVTIGGNYTLLIPNTSVNIYGEAAIGLNVSYITPTEVIENFNVSFDPAFGFCYGIEAGIVLNDMVNIGVRYNNMGTYRYNYKINDIKNRTPKMELSNTVLVLGIRF